MFNFNKKKPGASLSEQTEMLRVRLEATLPPPMFVVLSSAQVSDGKGIVASALAHSMEAAGYSTLFVVADDGEHRLENATKFRSLDAVSEAGLEHNLLSSRGGPRTLILPNTGLRHVASRESVTRFASICRATYQVTIVDAATGLADSFAMLAAGAADGVLLTAKEGRRVTANDRDLAKTVANDGIAFLGVITVAESIIRIPDPSISQPSPVIRATVPTVSADVDVRSGQPV